MISYKISIDKPQKQGYNKYVQSKKESEFGYEKFIKKSFRGGGNLEDAGLDAKTALEAAKQLGSEAAKVVDAKTPRCTDAKSVTGNTKSILAPMAGEEAIVHERLVSVTSAGAGELAANSGDEHESIVGWDFYPQHLLMKNI